MLYVQVSRPAVVRWLLLISCQFFGPCFLIYLDSCLSTIHSICSCLLVQFQALARVILLCSLTGHFILTVPLFSQEHKWAPKSQLWGVVGSPLVHLSRESSNIPCHFMFILVTETKVRSGTDKPLGFNLHVHVTSLFSAKAI